MQNIQDYESVKYWMESLVNRSENTKKSYLTSMSQFCSFVELNPDEIYEERKKDLEKKDDPRNGHRFENKLKAWIATLEKNGYTPSTQRTRFEGVVSFFEQNYIKLDLRRTDGPSGESVGKRAPTKEELRQVLRRVSPHVRRLLLFLRDSGWRLGDVLHIKGDQVTDMGEGWWNIKVVTQKRGVHANGFVGPDVTKEFRELPKKDELLFKDRKTSSVKSLTSTSETLSKYLGDEVSAHGLRKYFYRTLQNPELHIHETWIRQLMGKKLRASDKPYVESRTEKLFAAYQRAYPLLSVEEIPTARMQELEDKIENLDKENRELRQRLNEHALNSDQVKDLLERIKKLEELAQH